MGHMESPDTQSNNNSGSSGGTDAPQAQSSYTPVVAPLSGKAAYEQRRQERMKAKTSITATAAGKRSMRRLARYGIILLVLAAVAYGIWIFISKNTPQGEDLSRIVPDMGNAHIAVGSAHDPYNSNPPTSGPHYAVPARPGFRDEPIADEHLVHSMEHGLIWLSYHPRISEAAVEQLREYVDGWTVITAREANDTDIAVAAWGRLDTFDIEISAETLSEADQARIKDFISRYRNRGPEKIPAGQHGGV